MGIMVYSLVWVMQGLYHHPYVLGVEAPRQRRPAQQANLKESDWVFGPLYNSITTLRCQIADNMVFGAQKS